MLYKIFFYLTLLFFIISCILGYLLLSGKYKDVISHNIKYENINFAGDRMPYQDKYQKNKFKFEKEFLINRFREYQIILYAERIENKGKLIEEKLENAGLPIDIKYVALAESALRSDVVSSAGAAGIWQFMPATGAEYGLRIDELIDERFHDDKATDAAISYFTKLYNKFEDWPLALASYNRGENAIARAMESQNADSYYDLYLNEETSRYLFRILSIKYIMENSIEIFGINFLNTIIGPLETESIFIEGNTNLSDIALEYDISYSDIKTLNPWILTDYLPEGLWKIKVLK